MASAKPGKILRLKHQDFYRAKMTLFIEVYKIFVESTRYYTLFINFSKLTATILFAT